MSFGFSDSEEEGEEESRELPHKFTDTLKYIGFKDIKPGMKVQSVLNGAKGEVIEIDTWKRVHIEWENGNKSKAIAHKLIKVVQL